MMKVLIIGANSFIYRTFKHQSKQYFSFVEVTRRRTGYEGEVVIPDFFAIDLSYFIGVDVVINFAAIVHQGTKADISDYELVNNKLAIRIAEKAKQTGVGHYVQMSTVSVYGMIQKIDSSSRTHPLTPYGISKLSADQAIIGMQDASFKVSIIRPPMVYGGGNAPGNMMKLIKLVDKGLPLPFKDVANQRDFINVHNLCLCLKLVVSQRLSGVFLLSDGQTVSTEFILDTIGRCLGKKPTLFRMPKVFLKLLSIIKPAVYDKLFGSLTISTNFPSVRPDDWQSVEQGISEMVQWYKSKSIVKK